MSPVLHITSICTGDSTKVHTPFIFCISLRNHIFTLECKYLFTKIVDYMAVVYEYRLYFELYNHLHRLRSLVGKIDCYVNQKLESNFVGFRN